MESFRLEVERCKEFPPKWALPIERTLTDSEFSERESSAYLWSAVAVLVGSTIGSGIFRTPPTIAGHVPNPLVIMALWVAFGVISLCGALTVAELSSMLPRTGGVYVFLREAYGDAVYDRLVDVKTAYDPQNVFHHNQNIRPGTGTRVSGAPRAPH